MIVCPQCKGSGRVRSWVTWDPGLGIKVTYEVQDVCVGCYGSGKSLSEDENAWNNCDFEIGRWRT